MLYLAQPYSNNPQENYETAKHLTSIAIEAGYHVFSPVVYFHELSKEQATEKMSYSFWIRKCLEMLNLCDAALFLELPNWQYSQGMELEERLCMEVGILTARLHEGQDFEKTICEALGSLTVRLAHQNPHFEE